MSPSLARNKALPETNMGVLCQNCDIKPSSKGPARGQGMRSTKAGNPLSSKDITPKPWNLDEAML
jgi:hypothetical protein